MIVLTSAELDDLAEASPNMTLGELAQLSRLPANPGAADRLRLYADNTYGMYVGLTAVAKRHGVRLTAGTYSRSACERAYATVLRDVKKYYPNDSREFTPDVRAFVAQNLTEELEQDFREGGGLFDV